MGFLAPWFLAGAALVGLPLYLHLLRRHATTPQPFSSLQFFERRQQASIHHRRLRYFVLLALRLALIALVVLSFANPFVYRSAAAEAADKLTLIVVDNSVSMRSGTRLADAKRQAASVLGEHRESDRVQIGELGGGLHLLTRVNDDQPTRSAAIAGIEPGDSRGNFGELGRAIRVMADGLGTPLELHLFSDLQRSKMPPNFADVVFPSNVTLVLHPVGDGPAPANWTVESVSAPGQVWGPPPSATSGPETGVDAVIAGCATPAATKTATLVVNGKTLSTRQVQIPASGRATVHFPSLDVPYGFSRCEVRIDAADALAADDVFRFAVDRSDAPKALFVHAASDSRSTLYVSNAVAAAAQSAFSLQPVTVEQAANARFSDYAFVVLSDVASLPSAVENELTKYVRGGGNVMMALGTSAVGRARIPVFGGSVQDAHNYGRELANDQERFVSIGDMDRSHPAVAKTGSWSDVRFYYAVRVDPTDARVVAKLTDQTPLLLDKKIGDGHVLLFTSGLDNLTNDLPLHSTFVPFLEESAQYLAGVATRGGSRLVDAFVQLRDDDRGAPGAQGAQGAQGAGGAKGARGAGGAGGSQSARGVEIIDPNGKRPLSLTEAATAQSFQLTEAGFYQIRMQDGGQDVIGVNSDRRASNLEPMPKDVQNLWRGAGPKAEAESPKPAAAGPVPTATEIVKKPVPLWWYVMMVALVAALVESFVASRYLGVPAEEP